MSYLGHFVASPLARALGWTILHSLWQGAVLATFLAVALLAVRSPRNRYVAACAALLGMLCAFAFTLADLLPALVTSPHISRAPIPVWNSVGGAGDTSAWYSNLASAVPWFAPFWLLGVFLIYIRAFAGCVWAQHLRRRGVCSPSPRWQTELARLSALLRLSRPVQLLESCLADVPMVLGHFRPLILIPVGLLAGLPQSQVEAILLHELAHIRRRDYLTNILQRLAEGLFFYHPASWWISSVIRAERENCCDDVVVAVTGNPREYARTLAALEQHRFPGRQPAVAVTGGRLMKRIHRLLYPKTPSAAWAPLLAVAVLLTVGALSLAAWQSGTASHNLPAATAPSDSSKYSKWLNEDVVYIIDDAERAAFEKLTTDAERDNFIEQFWERRNPHPGSSANAFETEHYRCIAFANQRFRTASGTPGWQTDRGHIHILYGPPDEIDSHPKDEGGSQKPAIEVWSYRHIEGIGDNDSITFIDRTGRSDYHLAPGNAR
jgi:GWxTD domain-containing protein